MIQSTSKWVILSKNDGLEEFIIVGSSLKRMESVLYIGEAITSKGTCTVICLNRNGHSLHIVSRLKGKRIHEIQQIVVTNLNILYIKQRCFQELAMKGTFARTKWSCNWLGTC